MQLKEKIEKLNSIVDDIVNNQFLIIDHFTLEPSLSIDQLQELEIFYEIKLPIQLKYFYQKIGALCLVWRADPTKCLSFMREPEETIGGVINLLGPDEMIADKAGDFWRTSYWNLNESMRNAKFNEKYKPFDFHGTDMSIGFELNENDTQKPMVLYDVNTGFNLFVDEFEIYLDYLIKYKGFEYWPKVINTKDNEYTNKINYYLPILFSDDV